MISNINLLKKEFLFDDFEKITDIESLEKSIDHVKKAQNIYSKFSQEEVDLIFKAASDAAIEANEYLAQFAVEETNIGNFKDKIIKNNFASEVIYNTYKDYKTCGIIENDPKLGMKKIATPLGIISAIIPTTNPTSTTIFKCLLALKTRNGIIISPHPRAKESTVATAKIILRAAIEAGAPENIIAWIDEPSLELTNFLMEKCDTILATGGPGMVKSAYSSGKPAIGVGPGNTPALVDRTADIDHVVESVIYSKTFDNGVICASEQAIIVDKTIYNDIKEKFIENNCYILNENEIDKIRGVLLINGQLNPAIVGQSAHTIAKMAGMIIPEDTKILIGEVTSLENSEAFSHEKLSPVLAMYKADNFDQGLTMADQLVRQGGYGHTSALYINLNEEENINKFQATINTGRILINTPSSHGAIGGIYNYLEPSLTLGCGSWGNNSISENVGVKHLLNIKTVAEWRDL